MTNTHTYILKQKLPGGHLKGDRFNSTGINERTGTKLTFNPEDEIEFFEKDLPPKYTKGNLVLLNIKSTEVLQCVDSNGNRITGKIQIKPFAEYVVIGRISGSPMLKKSKDKYVVILKGSTNKKYVIVTENLLVDPTYYWFVNSDGIKIREVIGRFPKREEYLKSVGNYRDNKESLNTYIIELQELTKRKLI